MSDIYEDIPEFMSADDPAAAPAPQVDRERQLAMDCLSTWGDFVEQKDKLRELASKPMLLTSDRFAIIDLVRRTERKVARKKLAAQASDAVGVDWPDERVEHYVRMLTAADDDKASERNRKGWSKAHSSTGHWCYAMLPVDRALAIKTARTIVGGYARQIGDAA